MSIWNVIAILLPRRYRKLAAVVVAVISGVYALKSNPLTVGNQYRSEVQQRLAVITPFVGWYQGYLGDQAKDMPQKVQSMSRH